MEVIHAWSAPRSLSTSLMYSFAQRDDTEVLDEPLYAAYLKSTGADRPYRDELLSKMHISKQRLLGLPSELMSKGKHFILIRNPLNILPSFEKVHPLSFAELGLGELVSIYSDLCQMGTPPAIVDADEFQQDPEGTLRGLCSDLEIPFQPSMLKWEAGPIPEDGLWASWWYKTLHKSTGFSSPRPYPHTFPLKHYDLLEQCLPLYNILRRHVKHKSSLLTSNLTPPSLPVPENAKLFAWVGDEIVPREMAKVSVFDSVVQGGDSVWEGLRIYKGKVFKLEEHLDRLFDSAKALAFNNVPTREEVKEAIFRTLITNGMFDNTHIRLSLTRGKKVTSGMSPAFNRYGCTLIVLAEWKPPVYDNDSGIVLVTATTRRNSPNNLDSKIHHNNLLNNILAKIESNNANVDDAIMLDKDGFVSETNATNIFMVKKGRVLTPRADYCLPGITRATVMELVVKENFILEERNISLSEFHTADEVWTTGTMGELSPVVKIDGRVIGGGKVGPVTRRLQSAYKKLTDDSGVPIPTYQKNIDTSCV
ncbi:PREDICTED: branched-chain-amino-acid aminotransferase-like protein 2 isoform X2 [Brassica oleracea var. oleracea]|uniref:branched-chain-amino-acid aminotransferase-like protein 2 isoform X2 n=1 Tax=Brassica oleracea var. oleracea TaxID=109376 RepID=UPI0006A6A39E|nr:PREDICTED: branched-chain-amino-acid aminotransferase-like protein 2 isoform X2 [Brassica oleracea var. oleracea]